MKKRIILIVALFLITGALHAQNSDQKPERSLEDRMEFLQSELDLTDDQYNLINNLLISHKNEMKTIRQSGTKNRLLIKQKNEELQQKISEVLTEEQSVKLEEIKDEERMKAQEKRKMMFLESVRNELALSDEQFESFQMIFNKYYEERHELKKQAKESKTKIQQEMKMIRENELKELSTILSDDQVEKYKSMTSGRNKRAKK